MEETNKLAKLDSSFAKFFIFKNPSETIDKKDSNVTVFSRRESLIFEEEK